MNGLLKVLIERLGKENIFKVTDNGVIYINSLELMEKMTRREVFSLGEQYNYYSQAEKDMPGIADKVFFAFVPKSELNQ